MVTKKVEPTDFEALTTAQKAVYDQLFPDRGDTIVTEGTPVWRQGTLFLRVEGKLRPMVTVGQMLEMLQALDTKFTITITSDTDVFAELWTKMKVALS